MSKHPALYFDPKGTQKAFFENIQKAVADGAKSLMLISADANAFNPKSVGAFLKKIEIPVFGGIFPEFVFKGEKKSKGSLIWGLDVAVNVEHVHGLSDAKADYEEQVKLFSEQLADKKSYFVFVDAMSRRIPDFLSLLYKVLGTNKVYIGGGAGSLSFKQKPILYSNQGVLEDAAQVVGMGFSMSIGAEHGWEKISLPHVVTESSYNEVSQINYMPALDLYQSVIHTDNPHHYLTQENFFEIAKNYPLGIEILDHFLLVRDPLLCREKSLIFVTNVPQNSIVYVLKGEADKLIKASRDNAKKISQSCQNKKVVISHPPLILDCISRSLFLGDEFQKELDVVAENLPKCYQKKDLLGLLTIGEIASHGEQYPYFYNKTVVVGFFVDE